MAVGVSVGLSLGALSQSKLVDKFFPKSPEPEKAAPTVDPKIIDAYINQAKQINQLELQLTSLKEDLRERDRTVAQAPKPRAQAGEVDVVELSKVLEANNQAVSKSYKRKLKKQREELVREHMLKVEGEILKVENKYRPVINKIRELEAHLETQSEVLQREGPARLLWVSCQALLDKMRYASQTPLEKDPSYDVLKQFAAKNNQLAISVLDSIPAKALKEGVQSEESLIDRFSSIDRVCKRVALVGESGGGIAKYMVSYLQSLFIIDNIRVPEEEIRGEKLVDPTAWNTFDILARVRYCLALHNLEQAIRYANQLKGQARVVARDWIRDARIHLETKQAFSVLSTHAEAIAVDSVRQTFVK